VIYNRSVIQMVYLNASPHCHNEPEYCIMFSAIIITEHACLKYLCLRVHWQGSLNLYLITFWSYAHFVLLKSFHTPLLSSQSTASEILGSINHINEGAKSHCRSKATGNIPARASYTSLLVLIRALYLLHIQIRKFHRPKKP